MRHGAIWCEGEPWAAMARLAVGPRERMRGLIGSAPLGPGSALLIERCGAVHTVGMRYALDLVFLDRAWRVVRVVRNVPPGRLAVWGGWRARRAIEAEAGRLDLTRVREGCAVVWIPSDAAEGRETAVHRHDDARHEP